MNQSVSAKISELRKARSLTQEKLGEMLGVSSQAVSKWENGDSLPDILLLPELCDILGISLDALLEVPSSIKNKNIVKDFCLYAAEKGKSAALLDAFSRMFNDAGNPVDTDYVDFGPDYLRIFDKKGMGFVVGGEAYMKSCLSGDTEDILYILRILCDEALLSVLRFTSMDKAVTREEIAQATGLEETELNRILTGFFKRGMIVCEKDSSGKRGYLQGDGMAGIYMILAGCQALSENGAHNGYKKFTRKYMSECK